MPYRRSGRRRGSYRSKARSGMRRRASYTKRRRTSKRSYRRKPYSRRSTRRSSRRTYRQRSVKQRRTMSNTKAYHSSTRASSLSGIVSVNSRELVATITQPLPSKYYDNSSQLMKDLTGTMTRAFLDNMGEASNCVPMPGGQQYVVPPNPTFITDDSWPAITSDYSANELYKKSFPNKVSFDCPFFFLDGGKDDGSGDKLYQQAGAFFLNCSPQGGQLSKLAKFAKQYDQYRILGVRLHYVPTCSTQTDGIFIMTFDANVTTFPPIFKAKMLQQKHCVTGSLYTPLTLTYNNPDKAWKWCTSPAGREYPQGANANRNPDRFSDSFYAYCRVFDSQKATQVTGQSSFNIAAYGYLYAEYVVQYKTPSNNNNLIADKDDIDMETVTVITAEQQEAALPAPVIPLAPMGLASKTPLPSFKMPEMDSDNESDYDSCDVDTDSETEEEEIKECLDALHGANGKEERKAAWDDLMQAYSRRLDSKGTIGPLLDCVKSENALEKKEKE